MTKHSALFLFLLFANSVCYSDTNHLEKETLYYKLSYRGILTSMIWADLADIKMTALRSDKEETNKNQLQFELYLSTENYKKAELFHPVRYTYRSTIDAKLQRTLKVEEKDTGDNDSMDMLWLDWNTHSTYIFERCEIKKQCYLPSQFKHLSLFDDLSIKLAYKESGDNIEAEQILDPLSLIYALRNIDFMASDTITKKIPIVVSDDIRLYFIEQQSVETFLLNGQSVSGIKFKLHSPEKSTQSYYIWLSQNKDRIPLRISIEAPLGQLDINLVLSEK